MLWAGTDHLVVAMNGCNDCGAKGAAVQLGLGETGNGGTSYPDERRASPSLNCTSTDDEETVTSGICEPSVELLGRLGGDGRY